MKGPIVNAVGRRVRQAPRNRDEEVRRNETSWSGAQQRGPRQSEGTARETFGNDPDRSAPKPMHRSLDHVIGVRIPASQPFKSPRTNNLRAPTRNVRTVREAHGPRGNPSIEQPPHLQAFVLGATRRCRHVDVLPETGLRHLVQTGLPLGPSGWLEEVLLSGYSGHYEEGEHHRSQEQSECAN